MTRTGRMAGAFALMASLLVLGACTSDPTPTALGPSSAPLAESPTPTPTPTPSPSPVERSLLSGRPGEVDGPVLAVKLDNTSRAAPHAGLQAADVVYLEQVEGGLSRYVAVFSTRVPKVIGPIRSARIADIELLPQYGKLAFAYSGANPRLRPVLAQAPFYDVSGDVGSVGYWRQEGRYPPYDFFGNGHQLLGRAPKAEKPRDVGFTFDDAVPAGGKALKSVTASWPSARAAFAWSPKQERWLLTMDGRQARTTDGQRLGGTTVIVQYVKVYPSIYGRGSANTPMSETVGRGRALVLRDGYGYDARWQRNSRQQGTTWTVKGEEIPLAPGQVWVLLVNRTNPADVIRAKRPWPIESETASVPASPSGSPAASS